MRYHKTNYLPVIYALLILWAIHVLTSCNATKQAANHLNKAFKKDRAYVAKVTRDSFPCTELLRTDTVTQLTDSVIWVECPESNPKDYGDQGEPKIGKNEGNNTVKPATAKSLRGVIKVPVHIPIRTQVINHYFEDSAKILLTKSDLTKSVNLNNKQAQEITSLKEKVSRRGKLSMWLLIAFLISVIANILQAKFNSLPQINTKRI